MARLPGPDSGRPPEELTPRLACVDLDGAKAPVTGRQVPPQEEPGAGFLELHCPEAVRAIAAMAARRARKGGLQPPLCGARIRRRRGR